MAHDRIIIIRHIVDDCVAFLAVLYSSTLTKYCSINNNMNILHKNDNNICIVLAQQLRNKCTDTKNLWQFSFYKLVYFTKRS